MYEYVIGNCRSRLILEYCLERKLGKISDVIKE